MVENNVVDVRLIFTEDAPKVYSGKINAERPLEVQLEERFITIQIYGIWKHIATQRISEIWVAKKQG